MIALVALPWLFAAAVAVCWLLLRTGWSALGSALNGPTAGPALVALAQLLTASLLAWMLATALLTVLGELPWAGRSGARSMAARCSPAVWRAAVLAMAGLGVVAGPTAAAPHHPAPPGELPRASPPAVAGEVPAGRDVDPLDGLVLPDRPTGGWQRTGDSYLWVRPGDTLWDLAAASLPTGADAARVAGACARWYRTNAVVIGSDPDLLLPGTRLQVPGPADTGRPHTSSPHTGHPHTGSADTGRPHR